MKLYKRNDREEKEEKYFLEGLKGDTKLRIFLKRFFKEICNWAMHLDIFLHSVKTTWNILKYFSTLFNNYLKVIL